MFKRRSRSASGAPIHRHTAPASPGEPVRDRELRDALTAHVARELGPIVHTWEDPDPRYVDVAVHVVAPGARSTGHTLITSGMASRVGGERRQTTELLMGLSPDWPGVDGAPVPDQWRWPLRLLRDLARLPHEFDTHLGLGHTVPNGDPAEPYAHDTGLCCALLAPPVLTPDALDTVPVAGEEIELLAVLPLYADETAYKLDHGAAALWALIEAADVTEHLDPDRPSALP